MEEIQIANYGIGGQYNPHFDYFIDGKEFKNNRIATWLGYISDVKGGGGTAFPVLGLLVRNQYFRYTNQWYFRLNLSRGRQYFGIICLILVMSIQGPFIEKRV